MIGVKHSVSLYSQYSCSYIHTILSFICTQDKLYTFTLVYNITLYKNMRKEMIT